MSDPHSLSISLLSAETDFHQLDNLNDEGLIGISQDFNPEIVLKAYRGGAFPWYKFLKAYWWYSPDPRMVLDPQNIKVSKSMRQLIRRNEFELTVDQCFEEVVRSCASVRRRGQEGTWITEDFIEVYASLAEEGIARSVEVWKEGELVGGLYGLRIGDVFFGESMFSKVSNASKRAFIALAKAELMPELKLIDCQVYTEHLQRMGADLISRNDFLQRIKAWT